MRTVMMGLYMITVKAKQVSYSSVLFQFWSHSFSIIFLKRYFCSIYFLVSPLPIKHFKIWWYCHFSAFFLWTFAKFGKPGDVAAITSPSINVEETLCFNFWFDLSVSIRTIMMSSLIWWIFSAQWWNKRCYHLCWIQQRPNKNSYLGVPPRKIWFLGKRKGWNTEVWRL